MTLAELLKSKEVFARVDCGPALLVYEHGNEEWVVAVRTGKREPVLREVFRGQDEDEAVAALKRSIER